MPSTTNLQYTTIKTPLPDFIYDGLKDFSAQANLYHSQPQELIKKISQKYNLPPEMLFLSAGNDESILLLGKIYGKNTYVFTPTYSVYKDVELYGGKLNMIPSVVGSDYQVSPIAHPDATLIYLANPNNPSGITPVEIVLELVSNNPQAIVVVDEAYSQFASLSVIDEVPKYKNMVVLRSFSKDYGMAGNRVGFVVAGPEVISQLSKNAQWANVSYLSVGAAMVALDHDNYFKQIRDDINIRRDAFISFLKNLNYSVFPSSINAALIKFLDEAAAQQFVDHLSQNSIVVSHGNGNSNIGLDQSYVRIAIGNAEQMQFLQQVIEQYSASQPTR